MCKLKIKEEQLDSTARLIDESDEEFEDHDDKLLSLSWST
jgi:hypothetical protein